jgi:hypothetical protein
MGRPTVSKPGTRRYGTKSNYSEEKLNEVLEEIKSGKMGQREAAKTYNIPRNTIRNKLYGHHVKSVGRPKVFTPDEEQVFVAHVISVSDMGIPISLFDVRSIAKCYLDSNKTKISQFKINMPGW